MAEINIDKLNYSQKDKEFVSYKKYFGEMVLDKKEIEKRIKLAEELEEVFVYLFSVVENTQAIDKSQLLFLIYTMYTDIVNNYLGTEQTPEYIENYANKVLKSIMDVTYNKVDNGYFSSLRRAKEIASNEANVIANYRLQIDYVKKGYKYKIWHTMKDYKVRETHKPLDETKISIFDAFEVGNSKMMFPKDYSLGASADEVIGCRCTVEYVKE